MSDIGGHLRQLRIRMGLTQNQLANALGLSGNSLISRVESGRVKPTSTLLNGMASFFDQDLEALSAMTSSGDDVQELLHAELSAMARESTRARTRLVETVDALVTDFDIHQQTLSNFLVASKLNLVWSLPRKLKRERQADTVWVLSPRLESEANIPSVRAAVASNLASGSVYRYLIPAQENVLAEARVLCHENAGGNLEVRTTDPNIFLFTIETVIYDPGTPTRMGLMVAPTRRPEFDIVLGANSASQFELSFESLWDTAQPI
jgi:transcriptional regulator with XRE-family HTH domain